jgi:hypothetical protein
MVEVSVDKIVVGGDVCGSQGCNRWRFGRHEEADPGWRPFEWLVEQMPWRVAVVDCSLSSSSAHSYYALTSQH